MLKLQNLSSDVFNLLLIKGYSFIFIIIFFIQIINGVVISLHTFYQSEDLEVLFTSPVNRTALFFSRFFETHLKASWMLVVFGMPLLISSGLLYKTNPFYYVYSLLLFMVFSTIPVNIGIATTMFLLSLFHIKRLKLFLVSTGTIAVIGLVVLLRIFKPERFINPELFANTTFFLSEMKMPSYVLLPNRWLSEAIFNYLGKTSDSNTLIFVCLLILTCYLSALSLLAVFKRTHYRGWELMHRGGVVLQKRGHAFQRRGASVYKHLAGVFGPQSGFLVQKELLQQLRDVKTLHQTLIVLSLMVIYLFSIAALPLNWEGYAVQLKYLISFFNIGLILIIIAAFCSRTIYPDIVSEGASFWLIKTSPLTPKRYILTKYFFYLVPLAILGQLLIIFSSYFIGVARVFIIYNSITVLLVTFSLAGIAIAFGMYDIRSAATEDATKTGTTAQMLASIFLILFTLVMEALPVFIYYSKEKNRGAFTPKAIFIIGAVLLILIVINIIVTFFSLRQSVRSLEKYQSE